jgi:hypothetical protein
MGSSSLSGMTLNAGPSSARPPSVRMPHSRAMWRAVWMLSPVTMRTMMPAFWQVATAAGTCARHGVGGWVGAACAARAPAALVAGQAPT